MLNAWTAIAALVVSVTVLAQQAPPGLLDSYARARQIIDRAVAAHGGLDALRSARQMRVTREGHDVWRHQSRAVAPPYDRERFTSELQIDLSNGRLIAEEKRTYPGGTHRHFSFVTAREQSYYVNHRSRTYRSDDYPPAETQTGNLYTLPQLAVLAAYESGMAARSLGRIALSTGTSVAAVVTTANGGSLTAGFDPDTYLLRAILSVRTDAVEGPAANETEFLSYRTINSMLMPERRVTRVAGEVTQDTTFTSVTRDYTVPDAAVTPPSDYEKVAVNDTPAVRELAQGVWLVGGDAASLVVAMDDHVIIVDAPTGASSRIGEHLEKLAPGKPVRYVVPTHHHDDHAPGLRALARPGSVVLATAGNAALFERIARPAIEIVRRSRVFTSADNRVEIHDIGPSPHANEMLVAWLPADGILFSSDLIDLGAEGRVRPGSNNETTMHYAQWLRERAWSVRTHAGGHGGVIDDAVFQALIRQPIEPPQWIARFLQQRRSPACSLAVAIEAC
jgi:glyoxylase-like metal-dependent hydrolase (beta-lactamase superfamily II)